MKEDGLMPSLQSRMARALVRLDSLLTLHGRAPLEYQRFLFNEVAPRLTGKVPGVRREPADIPGIHAEWLIPEMEAGDGALLYLHGGGYVNGSAASHRGLASRIALAAGCRALAIDYRLAPEHRFPAAVEDAAKAYRWLLTQGYAPEKTVIGGDSAGGGLSVAVMVFLRDAGGPLHAAALLLSPWTDLEVTGESCRTVGRQDPMLSPWLLKKYARLYLGGQDPRHPLASPLHADLRGLPPMLIQVGTCEILLDDALRLAAGAEKDGVEVRLEVEEGMFHVWQYFAPLVPESREAVERLGRFARGHTSKVSRSAPIS